METVFIEKWGNDQLTMSPADKEEAARHGDEAGI